MEQVEYNIARPLPQTTMEQATKLKSISQVGFITRVVRRYLFASFCRESNNTKQEQRLLREAWAYATPVDFASLCITKKCKHDYARC